MDGNTVSFSSRYSSDWMSYDGNMNEPNSTRESLSEWTSARSLLQASSSSCSSSFSPSSSFKHYSNSYLDHADQLQRSSNHVGGSDGSCDSREHMAYHDCGVTLASKGSESVFSRSWPLPCEGNSATATTATPYRSTSPPSARRDPMASSWPCVSGEMSEGEC